MPDLGLQAIGNAMATELRAFYNTGYSILTLSLILTAFSYLGGSDAMRPTQLFQAHFVYSILGTRL